MLYDATADFSCSDCLSLSQTQKLHVLKRGEIVSHAVETLFVVRLGTCLPVFLTFTLCSHSHNNHLPWTPPLRSHIPPPPPATPPSAVTEHDPPPLPCSPVYLMTLGPVSFHHTLSNINHHCYLQPTFLHLSVQASPSVSDTPPTLTQTNTACSINIYSDGFVFTSPSFSFSTHCVSLPPTVGKPDDPTESCTTEQCSTPQNRVFETN